MSEKNAAKPRLPLAKMILVIILVLIAGTYLVTSPVTETDIITMAKRGSISFAALI